MKGSFTSWAFSGQGKATFRPRDSDAMKFASSFCRLPSPTWNLCYHEVRRQGVGSESKVLVRIGSKAPCEDGDANQKLVESEEHLSVLTRTTGCRMAAP